MSQDQNPSSARNVGGLIVHTTEFKYALENDRYAFQNSTLMVLIYMESSSSSV